MLATVRPRDVAGKTGRRNAAEELSDLVIIDKKLNTINVDLRATLEFKTPSQALAEALR